MSKFPPNILVFWENIFKHDVCLVFYDVCPGGSSLLTLSYSRFFTPARHTRLSAGSERVKIQETIDEDEKGITEILETLDRECKSCAPTSPLECMSNCSVWKLRNEFRQLCETMENPNYMRDLLNVLKNKTRFAILQTIEKTHSVSKLQQELKRAGYLHSQETLIDEYLYPLLNVGLAVEAQDQFYATTFGGKLAGLIGNIPEFTEILPSHSECHEENILTALFDGPKTFEEIREMVPSKIVSRILKRLKTGGLMETPEDRDYIFFFRSKRDPSKETLTATEAKVYNNIPDSGISAKKLGQKTNLSLRRTYKYVRGLKGKKLVFARKTPKTYALTEKGERLAWLVKELQRLVEETVSYSEEFARHKENQ